LGDLLEGGTMDDEIKAILQEILQTQREHLNAYRAFADKAVKFQEIALKRQRVAVIALAAIILAALLVLATVVRKSVLQS
jgi:hypothetical protein